MDAVCAPQLNPGGESSFSAVFGGMVWSPPWRVAHEMNTSARARGVMADLDTLCPARARLIHGSRSFHLRTIRCYRQVNYHFNFS